MMSKENENESESDEEIEYTHTPLYNDTLVMNDASLKILEDKYEFWKDVYFPHLLNIYNIFNDALQFIEDENSNFSCTLDDDEKLELFFRSIFNMSSGYISPHI